MGSTSLFLGLFLLGRWTWQQEEEGPPPSRDQAALIIAKAAHQYAVEALKAYRDNRMPKDELLKRLYLTFGHNQRSEKQFEEIVALFDKGPKGASSGLVWVAKAPLGVYVNHSIGQGEIPRNLRAAYKVIAAETVASAAHAVQMYRSHYVIPGDGASSLGETILSELHHESNEACDKHFDDVVTALRQGDLFPRGRCVRQVLAAMMDEAVTLYWGVLRRR